MIIKRLFVVIGNYLPPPINKFFYKIGGVKIGKNVWIGNHCYFDTKFPNFIEIENNVCISSSVSIIAHFDPTKAIKFHVINKYKKKIIIKKNCFIGPNSIINPGVIINKNSFIRSGSVIKKNVPENSIIEGNPQRIIMTLNNKTAEIINLKNKKYLY